ncbi:hypothetical protein CYLTODRAFT_117324 [Cylindrobasidium torrendii FP15055 ss-10]|uniref:Uncharacterized protein n=1 Tax=Cylindrobasidium torrendii FP15055 ss-10 TaxID=1314674 RepID=A0A0D7BPK2_9AGAR|nr:hypothetical protein CYLTODRAFT_117324 [Cylindrobasidium torrendii FP15055 ss-10]
MVSSLHIVSLMLAAGAIASPARRQIEDYCRPQFTGDAVNVLLSTDHTQAWEFKWPEAGDAPHAVTMTNADLTSAESQWYLWPNNGSSPDWTISTFSTSLLNRFVFCAQSPQDTTYPVGLTADWCVDDKTGYGKGAATFSIYCEECGENSGTHCFLKMPFIGNICPAVPASNSPAVVLTKCGYADNSAWDFVPVA